MKRNEMGSRFFKRRSVFFKTLSLLVALSILTVLIFVSFINQLVVKNQKKNINDLNLHQLQRISSDVELVFDLLAQGMVRSMWSENFIDLMIMPNQHDTDRAYSVIDVLRNQVEENELVRKSYFYLPFSDEVYVYSGTYMDREYLGDRDMIDAYLQIREEGRDSEVTSEWRVLLYNRRIFLAADFCLPNFVGVLFYEINRGHLYDIIQAENEKFDTTIYVYDENGNLLFDYMAAGLQPADFANDNLFLTAESPDTDGSYYMHTSETLGWKYLVRVNPDESQIPFAALISLLLPVLGVYVLISQMFSLYITRSVYRPINRLIQITTNPKSEREQANQAETPKTEIDYLELAYLDSLGKNQQHRELMETISDDILEQLLRGILSGKNVNAKSIVHTLEGIGRDDLLEGYYLAMAAELRYSEGAVPTLVEEELYQRSLLKVFAEAPKSGYQGMVFSVDARRAAVILCFPREASVLQIRELCFRLQSEVTSKVQELPYCVVLGKGKIYSDLASLQFSWHEAQEDIQYLQYMAVEQHGSEEEKPSASYEQRYYIERVRQIYALAQKGCLEDAEEGVFAMLQEIREREVDLENCYQALIDDVIEALISERVTQEEMKRAGISSSVEETKQLSRGPNPQEFMEQFYQKSLPLILESSRRHHNRYVEDAKEFMKTHYMEGTLTLNEISEAVGISSSYLSGIFAESTGIGVNTYLNDYRVEQARRFLTETNLNISEIGYKCGFNSAQSFGRVFKKHTGITPKQFREFPEASRGGLG